MPYIRGPDSTYKDCELALSTCAGALDKAEPSSRAGLLIDKAIRDGLGLRVQGLGFRAFGV